MQPYIATLSLSVYNLIRSSKQPEGIKCDLRNEPQRDHTYQVINDPVGDPGRDPSLVEFVSGRAGGRDSIA